MPRLMLAFRSHGLRWCLMCGLAICTGSANSQEPRPAVKSGEFLSTETLEPEFEEEYGQAQDDRGHDYFAPTVAQTSGWEPAPPPHLILRAPKPLPMPPAHAGVIRDEVWPEPSEMIVPDNAWNSPESIHSSIESVDTFHGDAIPSDSWSGHEPKREGHPRLEKAIDDAKKYYRTEGPLLRPLHEAKITPRQTIPSATVEPRWKAPYAYGYFGASSKPQWTRSTGYRDTVKRWTYR